ncbi:MAG TPA: RluA family pseudouridine synthase [Clostridia bacterium]
MTKFKVLYEDNHLLAVEKPVNMPVQKDISDDDDLLSLLKQYIKDKYNKPGNVFLGLVHRLDRPVGGAMVFARTSKAASRLSEQIRKREIKKIYLAVVNGNLDKKSGILVDYLLKDKENNIVKVVSDVVPKSRKAVLRYSLIEDSDKLSLVMVYLETGRSHQIRVQLSNLGYPILGDKKYGSDKNSGYSDVLGLWSHILEFKHPVKDEIVRITSNPPRCYPWNLFSYSFNKNIYESLFIEKQEK